MFNKLPGCGVVYYSSVYVIENCNLISRSDGYIDWLINLTFKAAITAKLPKKGSVSIEDLNSMIITIHNINISVIGRCNTIWLIKLSISRSTLAEFFDECTVSIKNLNCLPKIICFYKKWICLPKTECVCQKLDLAAKNLDL